MKLAFVQPKFDRSGGAERYALGAAVGLAARGHEVHLYGRRAAGDLPVGIGFHRVPSLPLGRALKTWTFWKATSRAVPTGRFDVVQGSGKTTCQTVHRCGGGVHRAFLERRGGRGEGPSWYDRVVLRIEDELFGGERLRAVVCPSSWVAAEVVRFYPAAAPKVRVIPNGVDTARFTPEGRDAERARLLAEVGGSASDLVVLFAATNFALKGLETAVRALVALPEARLVVAGPDDPRPFRALAAEMGVTGRLHFAGRRDDLGPLYRASDVLLHPTRYDPFANVCAEALACGTPVVTTGCDGVSDLVAGTGAGTVVPVADPAAAAEAVRALADRGPAAREDARALALRNDAERHLDRLEELYRELKAR